MAVIRAVVCQMWSAPYPPQRLALYSCSGEVWPQQQMDVEGLDLEQELGFVRRVILIFVDTQLMMAAGLAPLPSYYGGEKGRIPLRNH